MARRKRYKLPELAAEAVRRSGGDPYVVRLSTPPTASERLLLVGAYLQRKPLVIMPAPCPTVEDWLARYSPP